MEKSIYISEQSLAGKQEYLVEVGDELTPSEVKSPNVEHTPYDSHIYQLAAYCLMVQRVYNNRPPYVIL